MPWYGVLGYGCDPKGKRIDDYIFFSCCMVNKYMENTGIQPALVFSGGFTNPERFPGISEAMMMEQLVRKMKYDFSIYREEESLTTI